MVWRHWLGGVTGWAVFRLSLSRWFEVRPLGPRRPSPQCWYSPPCATYVGKCKTHAGNMMSEPFLMQRRLCSPLPFSSRAYVQYRLSLKGSSSGPLASTAQSRYVPVAVLYLVPDMLFAKGSFRRANGRPLSFWTLGSESRGHSQRGFATA